MRLCSARARLARAMTPAPPGLGHAPESRRVRGLRRTLRLRRHQPHFLPLPGPHSGTSAAGFDGADHGPIGLGHDGLGARGGQDAKALLIPRLKRLRRARRVLQGHRAHRRGIEAETVMFPQPCAACGKGMLDPEVGQHPLQPLRLASGADLHALREWPQIALPGLAPPPFLNADFAKDAPPTQGFFFRTEARGWAA